MTLTSSTQARKQRKAAAHAADHRARKLLSSHLDGDLLVKYNRRSMPVVLGDTVKVIRGSFRGHSDKVIEVDVTKRRVKVEGVTLLQADGTKVPRPLDASKIIITKLNLADPLRREKLLASVDEQERAKARAELEKAGQESAREMEELRKREEEEREKKRAEREAEEAAEEEPEEEEEKRPRETAEIEAEEEPPAEKKESAESDAPAQESGTEESGTKESGTEKTGTEESGTEKEPKGGSA